MRNFLLVIVQLVPVGHTMEQTYVGRLRIEVWQVNFPNTEDLKLAEAVKNGPSSIQELFGWPHAAVEQLFRLGDAAGDADAVRLKGLRLVMTADFSGMGTAELAVGMVLDAVKKHVATGRSKICNSGFQWMQGG